MGIRHCNALAVKIRCKQQLGKVFHSPTRPYRKRLCRNNIEDYKFSAFGFVLPAGGIEPNPADYLIKYLGTFSGISFNSKSKLDISPQQSQSTVL